MRDELLLVLHRLPEVAVEDSLRGITIDLHIRIHIALTNDTTGALLQITGTPGTVQIMQSDQPILTVGSCAHLGRTAEQYTHLTGAYLCEQLLLFHFGIGVVNKGNLVRRHAAGDHLAADILVHVEIAFNRVAGYPGQLRQIIDWFQRRKVILVPRTICLFRCVCLRGCSLHALRGRNVAEYQLCQPVVCAFLPNAEDVFDAGIDLAPRVIRQQRIDQALIQSQLSSVAGNLQHVVHPWINAAGVYLHGTLGQALHHGFLDFCQLNDNGLIVRCRRRQLQLIRRFDVRDLLEHRHQLRKVEELAETGSRPVASSLRSQLNGCGSLTEGRSPGIEVGHVVPLQGAVLQIPLHGVHLRHAVADGSTGREDHAASSGQLIHTPAFQEHIRGFLRFGSGKTGYIPHFRRQEEVLVGMRLVHKEPIHTQFLKGDHVILPLFRLQLPQTAFQLLTGALHLLDGELLTPHEFQLLNALGDLLDLLLQEPFLPAL